MSLASPITSVQQAQQQQQQQPVSAAQAIGEHLQSPDDLAKVASLRKKLEKEKSSIDARLKSGVKEQLDATRQGLRRLLGTRNNVQVIKDEMVSIERECTDPAMRVQTFDQISRVSMVHRNFEQTEEMVMNLLAMSSKLDSLQDMLADDSSQTLGSHPNLLPLHFQLKQLEGFKNQTLHQAKKASPKARDTLNRYFERLNGVITEFDEYLVGLAGNILDLTRAGNGDVVVRLFKIAEVEGREDEKAIAIRLVKKAAKMDAASKFKSMQANARVLKHYRSKFMRAVTDSIKAKFAHAYTVDSQSDPNAFLDNTQWIYQDIIRIEEDVVPLFPPDYEVYNLYMREYHKALNATLKQIIEQDPEATVLLVVHQWIKEYKKSMKELGVPPELMEPPLLDGKEQSLIEDYLALIIKKLDEWTANLMKTELDEFVKREEPPELDADGMYGTQGAVILFQMVNQQVDVATESGQGAILAQVISEVNRIQRGIQDQWVKVLDSEFKKMSSESTKPEDIAGGLVEYVMALANDQIKSADFTESLLARVESLVSSKYAATISDKLNDSIDGYLDVAKKCTSILVGSVFNDLKPATKSLFQQKYFDAGEGGIMRQIVETMRDYMADFSQYLNPSLLDLLLEDLLDAFLLTYLNALANAPKLRMPVSISFIKGDVSASFSFFATYKPAQELESYFEVVEMVLGMLEASKDMVFLSFWSFARVHGPNVGFVEGLMRCRSDLDRTAVGEVMESVKRKVKDEGLGDPPEPTIMQKVAVQGAFSRFLRT